MNGDRFLSTLRARRWWLYGGGLVGILALRIAFARSTARMLAVSAILSVMVLTYVAELWHANDGTVGSPALLGLGLVGIVAGLWLALAGTLPGLLFVAGGLLFWKQALSRSSGEST